MFVTSIPVTQHQAKAAIVRAEKPRGWDVRARDIDCTPNLRGRFQDCYADATSNVYYGPLFKYPTTTLHVHVKRDKHRRLVAKDIYPVYG